MKRKLESAYHPCGTCRMGSDDAAVTTPEGLVRGVSGLRVVDASLMPQATAGDLNAPTLALAERLSDLVRRKHLPEAQGAALLADPFWATRQRGPVISLDYANNRAALAAALLANARGESIPVA